MQHWQDWVFTLGQVIFLIALIPTLKGKQKPELSTSIVTGIILLTFSFAYFTLELWFSAVMSIFMASAWFFLGFQRYLQDNK